MHYKSFEWRLYQHGKLSQRMMAEMEKHLETCDDCMALYVANLEKPEIPAQTAAPIYKSSRPAARRRHYGWALVAALALIALSIGFTPQGRVVYAQIRTTLEDFGNSLGDLFGLGTDSTYVSDVNEIQDAEDDVQVKLDQVVLERDNLTYSFLISGGLPDDLSSLMTQANVKINGEDDYFGSGTGGYQRVSENPAVYMSYWTLKNRKPLPETDPIHVEIDLFRFSTTTRGGLRKNYEKNLTFTFDIEHGALAEDTQYFPLSKQFAIGDAQYQLISLEISPVRQRVTVQRIPAEGQEPYQMRRGNLIGFVLTTKDGKELEFSPKSHMSDTVLYETTENQYEILKNNGPYTLVPYESPKIWDAQVPGVKGFRPLTDATLTITASPIEK